MPRGQVFGRLPEEEPILGDPKGIPAPAVEFGRKDVVGNEGLAAAGRHVQ